MYIPSIHPCTQIERNKRTIRNIEGMNSSFNAALTWRMVPPHVYSCQHVYIYRLQLYNLSAESVELHLIVTMELRQRILDLYHQFSLSGLDVSLNLWYRGVFHTHEFSSILVRGFSVIRMKPEETKNTNSDLKPKEKDKEKKRNPEACKWNPRSNFFSSS